MITVRVKLGPCALVASSCCSSPTNLETTDQSLCQTPKISLILYDATDQAWEIVDILEEPNSRTFLFGDRCCWSNRAPPRSSDHPFAKNSLSSSMSNLGPSIALTQSQVPWPLRTPSIMADTTRHLLLTGHNGQVRMSS